MYMGEMYIFYSGTAIKIVESSSLSKFCDVNAFPIETGKVVLSTKDDAR